MNNNYGITDYTVANSFLSMSGWIVDGRVVHVELTMPCSTERYLLNMRRQDDTTYFASRLPVPSGGRVDAARLTVRFEAAEGQMAVASIRFLPALFERYKEGLVSLSGK